MKLSRWLQSIFAWRTVRESISWIYKENIVTGERKAIHIDGSAYQPLDNYWLERRSPPTGTPPSARDN